MFKIELFNKIFYLANINKIRLKPLKLWELYLKALKIKVEKMKNDYNKINKIL